MGVKDLWKVLEPVKECVPTLTLRGKMLAVDLSLWVCEAEGVAEMRGRVAKPYLRNLFFRVNHLTQIGVKLVFVVDGEAPDLKIEEMARRQQARFPGKNAGRGKASAKTATRSHFNRLLKECCEMLDNMGIPYLQSAGEAEALAALLNKHKLVDGVITNDGDAFLYGAQTICRNFSMNKQMHFASSKHSCHKLWSIPQESHLELYRLRDIESQLGLDREKLIALGLFLGCDYAPKGVPGVGYHTAMKYLSELPGFDVLARLYEWSSPRFEPLCRVEEQIRKKALTLSVFPNTKVVNEFLKPRDRIPTQRSIHTKRPKLFTMQKFLTVQLEWEADYAFEKALPLVTFYDLNAIKSGSNVSDCLKPYRIVKSRVRQFVPVYEIEWYKQKRDTLTVGDYYMTFEEQSLFQTCYPDLVTRYTEEQDLKTKGKKAKKTKVHAVDVNSDDTTVTSQMASLSLDIEKLPQTSTQLPKVEIVANGSSPENVQRDSSPARKSPDNSSNTVVNVKKTTSRDSKIGKQVLSVQKKVGLEAVLGEIQNLPTQEKAREKTISVVTIDDSDSESEKLPLSQRLVIQKGKESALPTETSLTEGVRTRGKDSALLKDKIHTKGVLTRKMKKKSASPKANGAKDELTTTKAMIIKSPASQHPAIIISSDSEDDLCNEVFGEKMSKLPEKISRKSVTKTKKPCSVLLISSDEDELLPEFCKNNAGASKDDNMAQICDDITLLLTKDVPKKDSGAPISKTGVKSHKENIKVFFDDSDFSPFPMKSHSGKTCRPKTPSKFSFDDSDDISLLESGLADKLDRMSIGKVPKAACNEKGDCHGTSDIFPENDVADLSAEETESCENNFSLGITLNISNGSQYENLSGHQSKVIASDVKGNSCDELCEDRFESNSGSKSKESSYQEAGVDSSESSFLEDLNLDDTIISASRLTLRSDYIEKCRDLIMSCNNRNLENSIVSATETTLMVKKPEGLPHCNEELEETILMHRRDVESDQTLAVHSHFNPIVGSDKTIELDETVSLQSKHDPSLIVNRCLYLTDSTGAVELDDTVLMQTKHDQTLIVNKCLNAADSSEGTMELDQTVMVVQKSVKNDQTLRVHHELRNPVKNITDKTTELDETVLVHRPKVEHNDTLVVHRRVNVANNIDKVGDETMLVERKPVEHDETLIVYDYLNPKDTIDTTMELDETMLDQGKPIDSDATLIVQRCLYPVESSDKTMDETVLVQSQSEINSRDKNDSPKYSMATAFDDGDTTLFLQRNASVNDETLIIDRQSSPASFDETVVVQSKTDLRQKYDLPNQAMTTVIDDGDTTLFLQRNASVNDETLIIDRQSSPASFDETVVVQSKSDLRQKYDLPKQSMTTVIDDGDTLFLPGNVAVIDETLIMHKPSFDETVLVQSETEINWSSENLMCKTELSNSQDGDVTLVFKRNTNDDTLIVHEQLPPTTCIDETVLVQYKTEIDLTSETDTPKQGRNNSNTGDLTFIFPES